MLRGTRGLLLLAIIAILVAVGAAYYRQRKTLAREAPVPPKSLPLNTGAAASDWVWTKDEGGRRVVEVHAKQFRQVTGPDRLELEGVELRLYKKDSRHFDLIRSAHASFDQNAGTLYSDGDVEITMGMPAEGEPPARLLTIHSAGVTFESKTTRAYTDRPASFTFDQGEGSSVGAVYDPNIRELIMKSQVELNWRGRGPKSSPMKIEAGELIYREREANVLLQPWSRLTRDNSVVDAGFTLVILEDGAIHRVEAQNAHGTDRDPGRNLEYSADRLFLDFTPHGEIQKITGEPNARLVSTTATARTTVACRRVELDFEAGEHQSVLTKVFSDGNVAMESVPLPRKGVELAETRKLSSETVLLTMRAGGKEIEHVETQAPGRLEFLPNRPGQRRRRLDADRMNIVYGPENQIRSFRAVKAATKTEPEQKDPRKPAPPIETWSKELSADFDPKTGQLARLEQWDDFRYQEGDRKALAQRAALDEARDLITLETGARAWDPTGSTSADKILLDQKNGDVTAQGHVVSTRLPDSKGKSPATLSTDEPLEATADRMQTAERNQQIHYEGNATAWQGANRIRAQTIDIDRTARRLTAHGDVRTQLVDSGKPDPKSKKPPPAPVIITVTSQDLVYAEADRLAHFSGGAHLVRPGMDVRAGEIRAWLNDSKAESSLDRAFADGKVEILRTEAGGRTLKGNGEHAEYYAADQRIYLTGGQATLVDSLRGSTRGKELTYYAGNDKLLVNGEERQPVRSLIRRR